VLWALLGFGSRLYLDWLWFASLGYQGVFQTILSSTWALRLAAWFIFASFVYINLIITRRAVIDMPNLALRQTLMNTAAGNLLTKKRLGLVFGLASLLLPWFMTAAVGNEWLNVRLFLAGGQAGVADPIFGRDVGFYLFSLPFFELLYHYLLTMLVVAIVLCGAVYVAVNPPLQSGLKAVFARRGQAHLSVLLGLAFLVRAYGYHLQALNLVYSPRGFTFGAGYTDMAAQLPAFRVLMALSVLAALVLFVNTRLRRTRLLLGSIAVLLIASILLGGVWPGLVQKFQVEPNEFVREEPFIRHNIEFTRRAYGLEDIERREFDLTGDLGYQELLANEGTLGNIRLWDWRPLRQTFGQLQGLRRYYRFNDVDTGRYFVDGKYRQLMLAAREISVQDLPTRTWVNERLVYTHGYGVVASPVTEVTGQGLPQLWLRDIPVRGESGLKVDAPQIYYGELTDYHVFTGTATDEFDYPLGETNAFYRYTGEGGVTLGGIGRRALFALRFADYRILVSGELKPESRVKFYRQIGDRARRVAPFLSLDADPYLVVNDGRLFWIIDAYTVSDRYPYAEPLQNINYIRNSVKVVVDAYHGTADYYVTDPDDVLVQAYSRIFPGLFKDLSEMPAGLRRHIRYPEQLLKIQSRIYATYHMQNTQVFYNREDQWEWPKEIYHGKQQVMEPYYTIIRLPGEREAEFVLMLPYTPVNRDNMVAWLAGRSDGDNYGRLVVYHFPKGELVYGPAQVEARINQDSRIAEHLTLWDQRGSSVIRGNLLVLPLDGSVLYVEPLYLQSEQSQLPELARVIVSYGERVVMERTLEEALAAVFGVEPGRPATPEPAPSPGEEPPPGEPSDMWELIRQAAAAYTRAEEAMRRGDWAEYGRLQQELGQILTQLERLTE
jgi:uncharacterized membrane protein (UPF0182 family)